MTSIIAGLISFDFQKQKWKTMNTEQTKKLNKSEVFCSHCSKAIQPGDAYFHNENILCEDCSLDLRTPLAHKTHWQYLGSIRTDYLVPGKNGM